MDVASLAAMVQSQRHRGPDATGSFVSPSGPAALGHNRLSIIDLSDAGRQPMPDASRRHWIVYNGELYNYLELRAELESSYTFRSQTDTEVLLAAFLTWGERCLERLVGMFAFAIWDERNQSLFAARDRFGVKPFYYHASADGTLVFASEIKALHAAGVDEEADSETWATYLATGAHDQGEQTFWLGIRRLPAGHALRWRDGRVSITRWYDFVQRVTDLDERPEDHVAEEYRALLIDSVRLRFRSDVPVGVNLSGGLDSSTLLGVIHSLQGADSDVKVFSFTTGDANYDELPWVRQMLAQTRHPLFESRLTADEVPDLAVRVHAHQEEPFGGLPTLAYAKLFELARREGVIVLLDGQGMDEQWAGYDYYRDALNGASPPLVQGSRDSAVRPSCLTPEFRDAARPFVVDAPFCDSLRNLQYRDTFQTKLPRALRFNDRVSMRSSTELREPFLDHRLFELAFRQPQSRKITGNTGKRLLREIAANSLPTRITNAPKRPLQTPQREWLRGPLRHWSQSMFEAALHEFSGTWIDASAARQEWSRFCSGEFDNSFFVWQWVSLGLSTKVARTHRVP